MKEQLVENVTGFRLMYEGNMLVFLYLIITDL